MLTILWQGAANAGEILTVNNAMAADNSKVRMGRAAFAHAQAARASGAEV
ncbi:hypothetical protein GCM10010970_02220 [Silvimonas iriomotensis]|uniref:Uncharacterized protein n=1 Tax=Silvimonas iriomotensis TaxID=449662 RepID=A0ABQ2P4C3_9NEIS|nr:hypothetical protein GCM10010970_02220 [Silvimonas iriomotensis]